MLYYAFYDGKSVNGAVTLDKQAPELWREIGRQAQEMRELEPVFLGGKREEFASGQRKIHVCQWTFKARRLLVVFSTERKTSRKLRMEIPNTFGAQLKPMFAGRSAGLQLANGYLSGTIEHEAVHVYNIELTSQ